MHENKSVLLSNICKREWGISFGVVSMERKNDAI